MGVHYCSLHINYNVYKHFDRSLHIGTSDPTCVQNFRHITLTVFEILEFKLKNEKDRNGEMKFLSYILFSMLVLQL